MLDGVARHFGVDNKVLQSNALSPAVPRFNIYVKGERRADATQTRATLITWKGLCPVFVYDEQEARGKNLDRWHTFIPFGTEKLP